MKYFGSSYKAGVWNRLRIVLLSLLVSASFTAAQKPASCLYAACASQYDPNQLHVHVVPHTHDDMGWLKTVDQYFWGLNNSIAHGGVQYVLDTVIRELQHDPNKRFIYVEIGYFWRWWMQQNDATRHSVQKLVSNGQLEFIEGGWVSPDEATTHYTSLVDHMSFGLRRLNESFGPCGRPRIAWQIDPFGHSRESAALYAQMGYDAVFFSRIHFYDYGNRTKNKQLEMVWHGSDDFDGTAGDIFAGTLFDGYGAPPGFCFDEDCDDDPIVDSKTFADPGAYNVDTKIDQFITAIKKQAAAYATNHIMLTMGSDFTYRNADKWFVNLDKLIKYTNARQADGSNINVFYSTPTCYVKALNDAQKKWPSKNDDFFPYASDVHSYWTGYFTSRPTLKGFIREANGKLQLCKAIDALAQLGPSDLSDITIFKEAMSVVQHHDAISGTAKQHVTNDYAYRVAKGVAECEQVINDALGVLTQQPETSQEDPPRQVFCPLANVSICGISQTNSAFTLVVFNGLSKPQSRIVRVPVSGTSYVVSDATGKTVTSEVIKRFQVSQIPAEVQQGAAYHLFFQAELPALGFTTFTVKQQGNEIDEHDVSHRRNSRKSADKFPKHVSSGEENSAFIMRKAALRRAMKIAQKKRLLWIKRTLTISNEFLELSFDKSTGLLSKIRNIAKNKDINVQQNFFWYKPAVWDNQTKQASGAYIFRPNGTEPTPVTNQTVAIEKVDGELVQEIRQTFSPWLSQITRLYKGQPFAEFEWTIGAIPVDQQNKIGKEVITRYITDIQSNGKFYTDSNGRQIINRTRNFQQSYAYTNDEPVAGNYYPVNGRIFVNDSENQITILTDRSQGGTSLQDGTIELMLHRRLLQDDNFGVDEALNETADGVGLVVRGKHWLIASPVADAPKLHRELAQQMFHSPTVTYSKTSTTPSSGKTQFSGIGTTPPPNVKVLTTEQWLKNTVLVRLEHYYQKGEDSEMSQPATVELDSLFSTFKILSAEEMTLGGNNPVSELDDRLKWTSNSNMNRAQEMVSEESSIEPEERTTQAITATLQPMQIKTFRCEIEPNFSRT